MCDFFCRVYESCVLTGDAAQIHDEAKVACQISSGRWPLVIHYRRGDYVSLGDIELSEWILLLWSVLTLLLIVYEKTESLFRLAWC